MTLTSCLCFCFCFLKNRHESHSLEKSITWQIDNFLYSRNSSILNEKILKKSILPKSRLRLKHHFLTLTILCLLCFHSCRFLDLLSLEQLWSIFPCSHFCIVWCIQPRWFVLRFKLFMISIRNGLLVPKTFLSFCRETRLHCWCIPSIVTFSLQLYRGSILLASFHPTHEREWRNKGIRSKNVIYLMCLLSTLLPRIVFVAVNHLAVVTM